MIEVTAGAALVAASVAVGLVSVIGARWRSARDRRREPLPPLVIPISAAHRPGPGVPRPAAPQRRVTDEMRQPTPEHAYAPPPRRTMVAPLADMPEPALEGETIRFLRPTDEPVQLLPGRLEVLEGDDVGQEIRFVRMPGEPPTVTLGRANGPPHKHVKLPSPTVSRLHARMDFANGGWTIANLSSTNPVHVNGEALGVKSTPRRLLDGDCVEMGELIFRFHER